MTDNTWGVWAVRSTGSMFGPSACWAKIDDTEFKGTREEAATLAREWNAQLTSRNVRYYPKERSRGSNDQT